MPRSSSPARPAFGGGIRVRGGSGFGPLLARLSALHNTTPTITLISARTAGKNSKSSTM
jgi:hypothetical protein